MKIMKMIIKLKGKTNNKNNNNNNNNKKWEDIVVEIVEVDIENIPVITQVDIVTIVKVEKDIEMTNEAEKDIEMRKEVEKDIEMMIEAEKDIEMRKEEKNIIIDIIVINPLRKKIIVVAKMKS
jgi:hypothetical protein